MGYMLTPEGHLATDVLRIFFEDLQEQSPTELELSYEDLKRRVEMEPVKEELYKVLEFLTSRGLLVYYPEQ